MKKFKILLSIVVSVFLISSSAYAASNLFEYYQQRGEQLPSIAERGKIYQNIAPGDYKGVLGQNVSLLNYLVSRGQNQGQNEENFGGLTGSAHLPQVIANFEDSLASKITSTATSLTLVDGTTPAGNTLSGWYGLTLESGSANMEYILANCTGTACTSLTRGLSTDTGTSTVASLKFEHRRGASVKITDYPNLTIITNILNGADGVPDKLYYDSQPTITSNEDIATKKYVDDVALVSAPDATESVKGVSELATGAEAAAGTSSGSAARLVLPASLATSSPFSTGYKIPVTGSDGKLSNDFLNTTSVLNFLNPVGSITAYATTTPPTGWLLCNGQTISSTTYATLFSVIGYGYASTTGKDFQVPDLRGRNVIGFGSSTTTFDGMGEIGGQDTHVQTQSELVSHTHTTSGLSYGSAESTSGSKVGGKPEGAAYVASSTGSGAAFNVLDPFIVLQYIIKF